MAPFSIESAREDEEDGTERSREPSGEPGVSADRTVSVVIGETTVGNDSGAAAVPAPLTSDEAAAVVLSCIPPGELFNEIAAGIAAGPVEHDPAIPTIDFDAILGII